MIDRSGIRLLIAEDERNLSAVLQRELQHLGYEVSVAADAKSALAIIDQQDFDVALFDILMPGMSGIDLLRSVQEQCACPPEVIMMTGQASVETAITAMKLGAYDYLTKPCRISELDALIAKAYEKHTLSHENVVLHSRLSLREQFQGIITESPRMNSVLEMIKKVAPSDTSILVAGESGTGKELVANALHHLSNRKTGPLIDVNCAAIQDTLMESELFGHEEGAFTSARNRKLGLMELAHRGTLFMDEIGELSSGLQSKLLRAIETKTFFRVGGTKKVQVDVRVVAASNRNLIEMVEDGKFRRDLYHRINTICIDLPALRERGDDVSLLAHHFLAHYSGKNKKVFSDDVVGLLQHYYWPGNVRELKNVIERAVLLSNGTTIRPNDLPLEIRRPIPVHSDASPSNQEGELTLDEMEREQIITALDKVRWHRGKAAKLLGISPKTLYRKIQSYGLNSAGM